MVAYVASVAIYLLPIMMPIAETDLLFKLIVLMPFYHSQYISIMSVEQMGNGMLYAVWAIPVAIILITFGFAVSCRVFAKHQVS
jgi:hypothetical protein